jgi:hypothetical protein
MNIETFMLLVFLMLASGCVDFRSQRENGGREVPEQKW